MTTNTPARVEPAAAIKARLDHYRPVLQHLLAQTDVSLETFVSWVGNAVRANPDLLKCEPETVAGAALRCAQLSLAPNDGSNLAWIIPYGRVATFQLGYGGVMELARRANPGAVFEGRAVYPNDDFDPGWGDGRRFKHVPYFARRSVPRKGRGGDAYAWYVRVTWPNGLSQTHVVDREEVERHRQFSRQPGGEMWSKSYDAAALKTAVLDMRRWLPHSRLAEGALAAEGEVSDIRAMGELDEADTAIVEADADRAAWVEELEERGRIAEERTRQLQQKLDEGRPFTEGEP